MTRALVLLHTVLPGIHSPLHVQVYEALNVLGAVPWQINRAVLGVVEQLYEDETGYKHLKIPAKESFDLPLPVQPPHGFRTTRTRGGALMAGVRMM